MLEFWIDAASPLPSPIFQEEQEIIFHCAGGMRSALAAKTAQDMGLKPVAIWAAALPLARRRRPVEKWEPKKKGNGPLVVAPSFRGARSATPGISRFRVRFAPRNDSRICNNARPNDRSSPPNGSRALKRS